MAGNMGPCNKGCTGCEWLFRPGGSGCIPICEYYLSTGEHRYPNEDGTCAVKESTDQERYVFQAKKQRKPRKPVVILWDTEKALEMWKQGLMLKTIAAEVGTSHTNLCVYANKHWSQHRPLREAAIVKMGGQYGKDRR